jgi:hypothetical protein
VSCLRENLTSSSYGEGLETGEETQHRASPLPDNYFSKLSNKNLTVKTFVGTSENALRIQIWTALIALLLVKWLHHLSQANWSLSNLASMLRLNLFTYRQLTQWIDNPMGTPPLIPAAEQLTLALV